MSPSEELISKRWSRWIAASVIFLAAGSLLLARFYESDFGLHAADAAALLAASGALLALSFLRRRIKQLLSGALILLAFTCSSNISVSVACVLIGGGFLAHSIRSRNSFLISQMCFLLVCWLSGIMIVARVFGMSQTGSLQDTYLIPFGFSLCLLALSIGALILHPREAILGVIMSPLLGGTLARKFLPAVILVPLVLGWVRLKGQQLGFYESEFGASLMGLLTISVLMALLLAICGPLNRMHSQLHENTSFLDSIFENMPNMVFVKDARDLRFVRFNKAGEKLVGFSRSDLLGKSDADLFSSSQALHFMEDDRAVLRSGSLLDVEESIQTRSGETRILHTKKIPLMDSSGNPGFLLGISEDVTEKKKAADELINLNLRLKHNVQELEILNRELESFSYSVSHDLRAPLRSMIGFSHAVLESDASRLTEQGRKDLERVLAASQRMGQLIDGLLSLSRLTRKDLRNERVDLSALAREIAEDLRKSEPDRQASFAIQDQVIVNGDPELLRTALDNLLRNAWKFTGRTDMARIEFAAVSGGEQARADGNPSFFVRDNGAGFDMAYSSKLFGAFQRLHANHEFDGTGIGLATVARIIHRHGGKVWAEGVPGKGAAFYFSIRGGENSL